MFETILFYSFAGLAVGTALCVVFCRHPVYSVLYLMLTMFALAGIYCMLQAYFIAAIQLVVYAGAILVLFLFVVMLLNLDHEGDESFRAGPSRWFAIPFGLAFLCELVHILKEITYAKAPSLQEGTTEAVGRVLFTKHYIPFEVISFLLLAAILGATVLSKRSWRS